MRLTQTPALADAMTEDEEEDQFLLVEDDRMEDVIILSEPSSETE